VRLPRFRGHQDWRGCSPGGLHGQDTQDIEEAAARSFTPEFIAEAVRRRRIGDRSVAQGAKEPDLSETAPCEWVQRAMSDVQDGDLSVCALASAMRARGAPRGVLVHSDGGGI
jgi:hypothetical protein